VALRAMSPNLPGPIPDSTRPLDVTMPADVTNLMTSQQNATGGAATKVVGTPDPALTGTLTGLLPADGVIATYTQTPGETAGTYTITATLASTAALSNYSITNNTAAFTITPSGPVLGLSPASLTFQSAGQRGERLAAGVDH
jgi:MBG domain (YGX type)